MGQTQAVAQMGVAVAALQKEAEKARSRLTVMQGAPSKVKSDAVGKMKFGKASRKRVFFVDRLQSHLSATAGGSSWCWDRSAAVKFTKKALRKEPVDNVSGGFTPAVSSPSSGDDENGNKE